MGLLATRGIRDGVVKSAGQHCPNCGAELAQSLLHGRVTHLCPHGHGRAFSASSVRAWIVDDFQVDFGLTLEKGKNGTRGCPRCHKQFMLSRFYRLPIEHCRHCSLVWLSDGLLERMPLRPEREREHAGAGVSIPVKMRFDPGVETVDDLCSPFEGVRYGKETPWGTLGLAIAFALFTAAFWFLGYPDYFVSVPREPFRYFGLPLVLALFTHADWSHLFGNGYFLFVAGSVLESHTGWKRYLILFFSCAVGARIAHAASSDAGSLGASGAISGIVIALVATQPKAYYILRPGGSLLGVPVLGNLCAVSFRVPIWAWAFAWFGLDLFLISQKGVLADGVSHAAHLGGAVLGAMLASQPYFQGPEAGPARKPAPRSAKKAVAYHK